MQTILLDVSAWDLVIDVSDNIAMASDPYSMAQDAASAIKTFSGEAYYDTTLGVPFFADILAKFPPLSLMKAKFISAALTVPGVVGAQCFLRALQDRTITGQVQIEDINGHLSSSVF